MNIQAKALSPFKPLPMKSRAVEVLQAAGDIVYLHSKSPWRDAPCD